MKGKLLFYGLSLAVLAIIALCLYFFNQEFFNTTKSITIIKAKEINTPELAYYWHFLIVFAFGFVVREFFRIVAWFGKRKGVKDLNRKVRRQQEKITTLENELELIRSGSPGMEQGVLESGKSSDDAEIIYSKEGTS